MEFKRRAVAFMAVAFLFPVKSFAETAKVGDIAWGFRTDKKLNDMTNLWEPKNVGVLDKNTGITHVTEVTKVACVIDSCFYRTEYKGIRGKKEEMHVFNTEDIAPKNSGNKKNNIGDKDVEENAKKIGVEKEKLRKALEDENEYQRLLREIQVKKAEQLRKEQLEKEKNKNSGKTGGNGNKKIEKIYVNEKTGAISDTFEGACTGKHRNGWPVRFIKGSDGEKGFCQVYDPDPDPNFVDGRPLGSAAISEERVTRQEGDCAMGSNKTFGKNNDGTFSVVCTYKHKPNEESPSVASTSNSSSNTSSPDSSRHNSWGGASAGGGNAPGGGSSGASTAGGSTSPGNSETGGGLSGVNSNNGSSSNSVSSGNSNNSSGSGTGSGNGEGNGENEGDFQGIPKYGEPDWGNLKSDGGFGNFSPSNAFSTGGSCMADVQLDMGEFGNHTLPMSFLCQVLEKLRYVFISMAYLYSAILVFKTVNSLKG